MHQRWNRSHYGRKRRNGSGLGGLDEETMVLVSIIGIRVRTNNHREFECDAVRVGCERSRGGERQRVVVQISDFTPPNTLLILPTKISGVVVTPKVMFSPCFNLLSLFNNCDDAQSPNQPPPPLTKKENDYVGQTYPITLFHALLDT